MVSRLREKWPVLLAVVMLVLSLTACGAPPTAEVQGATATRDAGPDEPPASPTAAHTATPADVATEEPTPTNTPTPTPVPLPAAEITPTTPPSRCDGLSGTLELQVLVGPADAAGMEPVAVGNAPFSVVVSEPPYLVQGGGPVSYEEEATFDWGTYSVSLSMDTTVSGECTGSGGGETLSLVLEGTGEQLLVVDASGFHGEYPWEGTNRFDLTFPLQDGAQVEGEGYVFVLHLPGP